MSENHINCMKKLDDETFEYSDQGSKSRDIVDYVGKIQNYCRPLGFQYFLKVLILSIFLPQAKLSVFQYLKSKLSFQNGRIAILAKIF